MQFEPCDIPEGINKISPPKTHAFFGTEVWQEGKYWSSGYRHNLTTDTASGFTNRRDWQSKIMAGGLVPFATATGAATATSATSLTNSGAAFPTAGQALNGYLVCAGPNSSGTGAVAYGMIQSNTATVLTIDQWYNPASTIWAAVVTPPNATASYQIIPGNFAAFFLALSTDGTAPSAADTTLASEITTNGLQRVAGAYSHTAAATTYVLTNTFTCTGGSNQINKECVGGSIVAAKGVMPYESAEPTPPTLGSGDTIAQTVTITIN